MREGEQLHRCGHDGGPGNHACTSVDFLFFVLYLNGSERMFLSEDAATGVWMLYSSVSPVKLFVATDGTFMSCPGPNLHTQHFVSI